MEKRRYHRYTRAEDIVIRNAVKKNPQNLSKVFIAVSRELGTSPRSVKTRYYGYIAPNQGNPHMSLVSPGKKYMNYKVLRKDMTAKIENNTRSKWRRILDILFE